MLIPKRAVCRVKPLLGIGQIQLKTTEQSPCSLNFSLVFLERFIEPASRIFAARGAECAENLMQLARLELLNLSLAVHDDGERRRLHATK